MPEMPEKCDCSSGDCLHDTKEVKPIPIEDLGLTTFVILGLLAACMISFFAGISVGMEEEGKMVTNRWREMCVERGVATWDTQTDGSTTFRWLAERKAEEKK